MTAPPERAFRGEAVLITRDRERSRPLVEVLERRGARAVCIPLVRFAPARDPEAIRRAVQCLDAYTWAVFTSATGVRFFLQACAEAGVDPRGGDLGWAAVGPATAAALREAGLGPHFVAEQASAAGLSAELAPRLGPQDRVLWVRPELAARERLDALEATGARVEGVAFYRTVPALDGVNEAAWRLAAGEFQGLVLTSPSSLAVLLDQAPQARAVLARLARVALGPTTAAALDARGLPAHAVASSPAPEAICEALVQALAAARAVS